MKLRVMPRNCIWIDCSVAIMTIWRYLIQFYVQSSIKNNFLIILLNYLKVHSYRAAIEKLIVKHWPELKNSGLRSIRHSEGLTFSEYCRRAVENLNIVIPENDINSMEINNDLNKWKNVVIFYTMRLLLASLVETVLLNDRLLYVLENGKYVYIFNYIHCFISHIYHNSFFFIM